jgi:hypothetical protein
MNSGSRHRRGLELQHALIDKLPIGLRAALAAACTQRQVEVYRIYARRTGVRTSAAFDKVLDAIWNQIHKGQRFETGEDMETRAERLYPGKEAKGDMYKGCAEIAVLSLLHSNYVLVAGKAEDTCSAAHEAFSSICNFLVSSIGKEPIINRRDPDAFEKISAHPLMKAEIFRQERDLREVQQALLQPSTIPDVVNSLRKRSEIEARGFLPLINHPGV